MEIVDASKESTNGLELDKIDCRIFCLLRERRRRLKKKVKSSG